MNKNIKAKMMGIFLSTISVVPAMEMEAAVPQIVAVQANQNRIIPMGNGNQVNLVDPNIDTVLGTMRIGGCNGRFGIGGKSIAAAKDIITMFKDSQGLVDLTTLTDDQISRFLICVAATMKIQQGNGLSVQYKSNFGPYHYVDENTDNRVKYNPDYNSFGGYFEGSVWILCGDLMNTYALLKKTAAPAAELMRVIKSGDLDSKTKEIKKLSNSLCKEMADKSEKFSFIMTNVGHVDHENIPYLLLKKNKDGNYEFLSIPTAGDATAESFDLLKDILGKDILENISKTWEEYNPWAQYNEFDDKPFSLTVVNSDFDNIVTKHIEKKQDNFEMPDLVFVKEDDLTELLKEKSPNCGVNDENQLFVKWQQYYDLPLDISVLAAIQLYADLKAEEHDEILASGILPMEETKYTSVILSAEQQAAIKEEYQKLFIGKTEEEKRKIPDPMRTGHDITSQERGIAALIAGHTTPKTTDAFMTGLCLVFSVERSKALLDSIFG